MNYTLLENKEIKPDAINCKYFTIKEELIDKVDVLIVSFFGEYPDGSLGKKHGTYISKKAISGIIDFNPEAIILDFRELMYNWGNSILSVFQDIEQFKNAGNEENEPNFPILIVTSEKSKKGLLSLLTPATSNSVPDFIFEDINLAIKEAEKRGSYWLNN
ncbi:hypothetical protein SAMN05216503_0336 [Polaribacter sp. KT25b]|uniref:hypothetical protein n=1 Tax=Polaribacter sp. KT25b TaxID=1855336 RepID=UPI00087BCEB7|nr:hypothetical protein [Polaribacter sp. KT25b]SDR67887.1 hypothetical protein SAMN05216503_0336 [Polaribacter sp. KT25b]